MIKDEKIDKFFEKYRPYEVIFNRSQNGSNDCSVNITLTDMEAVLPGGRLPSNGTPGSIRDYKPINKFTLLRRIHEHLHPVETEDDQYMHRERSYRVNDYYGGNESKTVPTMTIVLSYGRNVVNFDAVPSLTKLAEIVKNNKSVKLNVDITRSYNIPDEQKVKYSRILDKLKKLNIRAEYGGQLRYSPGYYRRELKKKEYKDKPFFPSKKVSMRGLWSMHNLLQDCLKTRLGLAGTYDIFTYPRHGTKTNVAKKVFLYLKAVESIKYRGYRRKRLWKDFANGLSDAIAKEKDVYLKGELELIKCLEDNIVKKVEKANKSKKGSKTEKSRVRKKPVRRKK